MKRLVMVIDDDPMMRETMELFLKDEYDVIGMQEAREALDYLEKKKVDMILLDIRLPEISGIVAFDMIRKTKYGADVPVIFLSGLSDRNTVIECLQKGASNYVIKPVQKGILLDMVRKNMQSDKLSHRPLLLIVSESDDITELKFALKEEYQLAVVPSVPLALQFVEKNKPEIILTDYNLTFLNGLNLIAEARKRAAEPGFGAVIRYEELDAEKKIRASTQRALCIGKNEKIQYLMERLRQAHRGSVFAK